jgi:hypothetical protein
MSWKETNQSIQSPACATSPSGQNNNYLSPPPTPGRCHALSKQEQVPEFFLKSQSILGYDCHNFNDNNSQDNLGSLHDRDVPCMNIKLRKHVPISKTKDIKHSEADLSPTKGPINVSLVDIPPPPFLDPKKNCCLNGPIDNSAEERKFGLTQEPNVGTKKSLRRRIVSESA